MPCEKCIQKWGAEPSSWGDSVTELNDYAEHMVEHMGESPEKYFPIVPINFEEEFSELSDESKKWAETTFEAGVESWPEEDDYPCASGCKPSEGDVCGGPRCT